MIRDEFTIHQCPECGRIEGEFPQAGCCPGCGIASEPTPILARRVQPPCSCGHSMHEHDQYGCIVLGCCTKKGATVNV